MAKLIIISGRSGAGKSTVLHTFEDIGYYCIDNLPLDLLTQLPHTLIKQQEVAISIDVRNLTLPSLFKKVIDEIKPLVSELQVIYLDAGDDILLRRFRETRRRHPLAQSSLKEAIEDEKKQLAAVADTADIRIDSTHMNVQQLRDTVYQRMHQHQVGLPLMTIRSFGFKYGIPVDTDFIFDVRCLPNPYWEPALRDLNGHDEDIINYLKKYPQVTDLHNDILQFIEKWLPAFEHEGRKYLTISIGCTGGQHRSVYLAEQLGEYFTHKRDGVLIQHRDLLS
ncbi:MAG: RNase adapter RapZ [Pseudomonadota bacterium]